MKWFSLIPEKMKIKFPKKDQLDKGGTKRKKSLKRQPTSPDEEIFERASEENTLSMIVTCSDVGFDLETDRNITITTD